MNARGDARQTPSPSIPRTQRTERDFFDRSSPIVGRPHARDDECGRRNDEIDRSIHRRARVSRVSGRGTYWWVVTRDYETSHDSRMCPSSSPSRARRRDRPRWTTSTRHDATRRDDRDRPRWTSTRRRWRRRRTSRPIASVSVAEEDVDDGIITISDIIVARRGGRRLDAARGRWSFVDYRRRSRANRSWRRSKGMDLTRTRRSNGWITSRDGGGATAARRRRRRRRLCRDFTPS